MNLGLMRSRLRSWDAPMSDLDSSAIRARCEAAKMDGPRLDRMQRALHKAVVAPAFDTACFPPPLRTEFQDLLTGYRALLDVNDRLLAEIERLNAVISAVETVAVRFEDTAALSRRMGGMSAYGGGCHDTTLEIVSAVRAALATEVKP